MKNVAGNAAPAATGGASAKTYARFTRLPLGAIRARGWLARQMRVEADGMSGHLDELEPDMIGNPYVTRSRKRGVSAAWCSEISATYWTGLIQLAFTLGDPALMQKAAKWVRGVLAAQEPDGYLGSYRRSDDRRQDFNAFGVAWAVRALTAYYEATGDAAVIEACRRGLLWFVGHWGRHRTGYCGPMIIEGMADVYLRTGDRRLLRWAEEYMSWLGKQTDFPNSVRDLSGPRLDYNSVHAVAYGIWAGLPAALFAANGRSELLRAGEQAARKAVRKCFQLTGGPTSNNEFNGPPGSTCETEYCNFATYADTFSQLGRITGKPSYGDLVEKAVLNGSQGAKKKDGRAIAYMTSPNQYFATSLSSTYGNRPDMEVYAPVYPVACCSAQAVRVLPEYVRGLCLSDKAGGVVMPWYGPCRIDCAPAPGVRLRITEETDYPFRETVEFTLSLNRPARVPFRLRIPAWCGRARLAVNGKLVRGTLKAGRYFRLSRVWKAGDTVRLTLPMDARVVQVNDRDFSAKRPLAVERGPLLFCLPIKPDWKPIPGRPLTRLPKGWSWFEATPINRKIPGEWRHCNLATWNYALNRQQLERPRAMRVIESRRQRAMPWVNSPVTIRVPARRFTSVFPQATGRNVEIYLGPDGLLDRRETIELVPYGCTNLRVSYFPRY